MLLLVGIWAVRAWRNPQNQEIMRWAFGDSAERAELTTVMRETCPNAPFVLPTDGFIGLLFGDPRGPYSRLRRHQGIDIFTDQKPGTQPVYAAYDGYLTRERDWVSTVILRVPEDPLDPSRQIWLYYTHMADEKGNDFIEDAFPRGTSEFFVEQGTLLGYVGNYDGNAPSRIWTHLHFSIVRDDGNGHYLGELDINNTLDPSAYLGLPVHYSCAPQSSADMVCTPDPLCES